LSETKQKAQAREAKGEARVGFLKKWEKFEVVVSL